MRRSSEIVNISRTKQNSVFRLCKTIIQTPECPDMDFCGLWLLLKLKGSLFRSRNEIKQNANDGGGKQFQNKASKSVSGERIGELHGGTTGVCFEGLNSLTLLIYISQLKVGYFLDSPRIIF